MKSKIVVLSEDVLDFKYRNIFVPEDFDFRRYKFHKLLLTVLSRVFSKNTDYIVHVRYLKWRGYVGTLSYYMLLGLFCKVSRIKLYWTCHNIYEHYYPSKKYNRMMHRVVGLFSKRIFVFHDSLIQFLPKQLNKKTLAVCFGDHSTFFNDQSNKYPFWSKWEDPEFPKRLDDWLNQIDNNLDLVTISGNDKVQGLVDYWQGVDNLRLLVISTTIDHSFSTDNIFAFKGKTFNEVPQILKAGSKLIGYVGHANLSVPTSIYMFVSFGIPVIGRNISPIKEIIGEGIGLTFDDFSEIPNLVAQIQENYEHFSTNATNFISKNKWSSSADIHRNAIRHNLQPSHQ